MLVKSVIRLYSAWSIFLTSNTQNNKVVAYLATHHVKIRVETL